MKQLEQLPEMTAEMLGGLHARSRPERRNPARWCACPQGRQKALPQFPLGRCRARKAPRHPCGRVLATVCSFAFIIGLLVGIPLMIANPNHGNGALISTQIGGDPSAQPRSAHWRWICPRAASPSLSVKSPAIAASGPRPAGQTSRCCAWTAVTIVCLPTPPRWAAT